MQEAFDMAKVLRETPDLFPWVCLVIVLLLCYRERDLIRELFTSVINSRKETALYHAQHNELVRNNTAALENNTAMLSILKQDRHEMTSMLEQHEKMTEERLAHIQTVVNRIDTTVNKNHDGISIIADRTK